MTSQKLINAILKSIEVLAKAGVEGSKSTLSRLEERLVIMPI